MPKLPPIIQQREEEQEETIFEDEDNENIILNEVGQDIHMRTFSTGL